MVARNYKTTKGTELPLLNLRGKEYLEVKYRLVWFREEHPDWSIETDLLSVTETSAHAKATIRDEAGRVIATSHKFESEKGFPDFIEKAETGAIGRALALIGYGTQFCADELDEGKRIVDSPVPSRSQEQRTAISAKQNQPQPQASVEGESSEQGATAKSEPEYPPGEFTISFGRKYKGKKLKEINRKELDSYIQWLEGSSIREGTPLSYQVQYLKSAYDRLYGTSSGDEQH